MSNEKIDKIVSALKQVIQAFYTEYNKKQAESEADVMPEIQATLTEQLQMKTGLKSSIVTALVTSLATIISDQLIAAGNDRKKLFQQINLNQLISFDISINQDVCTEHCKKLKKTTATLMFKIRGANGPIHKKIECSLDEVRQFREEMAKIQE